MKSGYQIIIIILIFLFSGSIYGEQKTLNIYTWGNYFPQEIINQFTKETGIKINISQYDNNETMFAKLKTLKYPGYDIVIPSSYFVERMIKLGMLQKLDKSKLTNRRNLNPLLLNKPFDPKNNYSIPYFWGTIGIIVNTKYIDKRKITSWQNFWDAAYKDQLMILNDMRDTFGMALLSLGYSINDVDPKHIEAAYLKLKKLLPNIKIFNTDTIPNIYIDEDAIIGMAWSGDCKLAQQENPFLQYIYPQEGFALWLDSFAILKDAPHADNAHKFINFMLRPEIAKHTSLTLGHSTANLAAFKIMPKKTQQNHVAYPNNEIMLRGELQLDLNEEARRIYEKYWERLKINN